MRSTGSSRVSLTPRQVVFVDDGWRLKTDPAEHLDPAQSDSLVELHRWLDASSRSIRLADLLIEVENDLGFSVHFQRPSERVDPGEVCALFAAILAHGCNLGLYTMEKVAPAIAYRRLKYVSDWRLVVENQHAALAGQWDGHSPLPVGAFIAAIRRELRALTDPCGALLVCHTTKAWTRCLSGHGLPSRR